MNLVQAALATVIALVAGSAVANPTSEWSYIGEFQQAGGLTTSFNNANGLASTSFNNAEGLSTRARAQGTAFTLESATPTSSSTTSSSSNPIVFPSDVIASSAVLQSTLWTFVSAVRSQQLNEQFVATAATANAIAYTLQGEVPPVPLPPTMWMLLAGAASLFLLQRRFAKG